jgi:NADH-quinone oxidoreductase subunit M
MISELHFPWLECSILLPLIGAIACSSTRDPARARQRGVVFSGLTLLMTIGEWIDFATLSGFEAHDHWDVIHWLFNRDVFVIDELSAPLLPLTALLFLLTMLSTLKTKLGRFPFGLTLLSESLALATLSCHVPWIIIGLMSAAAVPPWLELRQRGSSARVFLVHMGLFAGCLAGGWSLIDPAAGPQQAGALPATLLVIAALLRSGVVPLHLWISDLFDRATFGTALLFVTPLTGAYAVMHLVFPVVPSWAMQSIAWLSLLTAVYAAALATVQSDIRRLFSCLVLSHSALVLSGLEVVTTIGLTGALCVWLSAGLSLGGFGLTLRAIEARLGRVSLQRSHGMFEHTPTLAGLGLITGLSCIGFPGTVGFIGMELLVEGAVDASLPAGLAVILTATLNSVAIVRAWFRIFAGHRFQPNVALRSQFQERIAVVGLTFLVLGGGLWPQPGVASRFHAAGELLNHRLEYLLGSPPVPESPAPGKAPEGSLSSPTHPEGQAH